MRFREFLANKKDAHLRYLLPNGAWHLAHSSKPEHAALLQKILLDFEYLSEKASSPQLGIEPLIQDFDLTDEEPLNTVQQALRLSARHVSQGASPLASQLIGRLLESEDHRIQELLDNADHSQTWLRPMTCSLTKPHGPLQRTLVGHNQPINALKHLPDRPELVSASTDNTVRIWDLRTGTEKVRFGIPSDDMNEEFTSVATTPEGTILSAGAWNGTIKIWDLETGKERETLVGHERPVTGVAIANDTRHIVSCSWDSTLKIWNVNGGPAISTLVGHKDNVNDVAVSPDGQYIASASSDGTVKIWDTHTGQELHTLEGHRDGVQTVTITPDGSRVISASSDTTARLWRLQDGSHLSTLRGHVREINDICVTPDGAYAITCSDDQQIIIWNLHDGTKWYTLKGHSDNVYCVTISPGQDYLMSGSLDGTIRVWRFGIPSESVSTIDTREIFAISSDLEKPFVVSDSMSWPEFDEKSELKFSLNVWNWMEASNRHILSGHTDWVRAAAISGNNRLAISASQDQTLRVWRLRDGAHLKTLKGHTDTVIAAGLSKEGQWAASGSYDGTVRLWNLRTGSETALLQTGNNVGAVCIQSQGGKVLLAFANRDEIQIVELIDGALEPIFQGSFEYVSAIALHPSEPYVVAGSTEGELKTWNFFDKSHLYTIEEQIGIINDIIFSPGGNKFISVSTDMTLAIWDLLLGRGIATFGADGELTHCAITPDGETIFAGDATGRIHTLRIENGVASHLDSRTPSKLDPVQKRTFSALERRPDPRGRR